MPELESLSPEGSVSSRVSRASKASKYSSTGTGKSKRSRKPKKDARAGIKEPVKPACDVEMIRVGLSQLGRTADGLKPAYLSLEVQGTSMDSADTISAYRHVQTLLIRNNELTNLTALSNLHSLTALDASGNKLTNVLGYELPPDCDVNLRHANFSCNLVSSINGLSAFTRLLTLDLGSNQVERICGLRGLRMLQKLALNDNRLISCMGLEDLESLTDLNLAGNMLQSLEPLAPLSGLESLNASNNLLEHLHGLDGLTSLQRLDISNNRIQTLDCISHVRDAQLLSEVVMLGNPVERCMHVRLHVVDLLPQVTVLNRTPVLAKEKVLSSNMHGADAEALRAIRRKYFPHGELDDGGGAVPPPSAGLVASRAEEERLEGFDAEFVRIDAWALSLAPGVTTNAAGGMSWWRAAKAAAALMLPAGPPSLNSAPSLMSVAECDEDGSAAREAEDATADAAADAACGGAAESAPLICLADQLASTCGDSQLLMARACWQWVAAHVVAPRRECTWSVHERLFGPSALGAVAELTLLSAARGSEGGCGAWAECAAWLFVQLARACQLEAVIIPGYWRNGTLPPGIRYAAHNHCWAAVKVNGRWRLVDPTAAALLGGAPAAPFFIPPEALIYSYLPLEAQWQLLAKPISLDTWWDLPECSVSFFARGCRLLSNNSGLSSVTTLPTYKEGDRMPSLTMEIGAPLRQGAYLSHTVYEAETRKVVASWPQRKGAGGSSTGQLAFQQVSYSPGSQCSVNFGSSSFATQVNQLIASFPAPGDYMFEISNIVELPGGMPLTVAGTPLTLRVAASDEIMRIKVVVPEPDPHDPEDGILHCSDNTLCLLPITHPCFIEARCELVAPAPNVAVEADCIELFEVVAPGAQRVALAGPDGRILLELPLVTEVRGGSVNSPERPGSNMGSQPRPGSASGDKPLRFRAELCVPRVTTLRVQAKFMDPSGLMSEDWSPLLTIQVLPQGQHLTEQEEDLDVPEIDPEDTAAQQAVELFKAMDVNKDGKVTRGEMLKALRNNRQIADILKLPPRIHLHDGTFERFVDGFLSIDQAKLGSYGFDELCAYMGIRPPESSDDGSYDSDDEEAGGQGDVAQGLMGFASVAGEMPSMRRENNQGDDIGGMPQVPSP